MDPVKHVLKLEQRDEVIDPGMTAWPILLEEDLAHQEFPQRKLVVVLVVPQVPVLLDHLDLELAEHPPLQVQVSDSTH